MKQISSELRNELINLSLATDIVAAHRLSGWRLQAVCAARWLLRAAAVHEEPPRLVRQSMTEFAKLCDMISLDNDMAYQPKD